MRNGMSGGMRVRMAPSPTGRLHTGNARTALYNWLLARHEGGTFILRIEDTDRARSRKEYLDAILEDLSWLGLSWDEGPNVGGPVGPYFQSERGDTYRPAIDRLLADGKAYRCFCTPEEIEARRQAAPQGGRDWRYDRRCLELSEDEAGTLASDGRPYAVRFLVPAGRTSFDDMILGSVEVDNSEIDDLVIARSDGSPTYNFVVVVDDLAMGVTHVVRGSDHISNTPKQILLCRALGGEPPTFGHLPLVLGPDKKVLSKRRGALGVGEYRTMGYLPEALVNYMALLGWSYDGEQEFFTLDELAGKFDIGRVNPKPAAFDPDKLLWMNTQWIQRLPVDERVARLVPFLSRAGLVEEPLTEGARGHLARIVELLGDRIKTLSDVVDLAGFFLAHEVVYDNIAVSKVLTKEGAADTLAALRMVLTALPDFDAETLEAAIRGLAEERQTGLGKMIQPLRVALTGTQVSPGIFETMEILGRETTLARIEKALGLIAS